MLRRMLGLTMHKVQIYLEYHMVSVHSSELGPPTPCPVSEIVPPPEPKEVGHTRLRVGGWGGPNSDDWRKSIAFCLLVKAVNNWDASLS